MSNRKVIRLINENGVFDIAFVYCSPGKYRIRKPPILSVKNSVVEFTKGYWIQEFPVSIGLFRFVYNEYFSDQNSFYGYNPSSEKANYIPMLGISFFEIKEFLNRLNKIVFYPEESIVFDIPSIAEWEHASLVGKDATWSWGDEDERLQDYAWFIDNAEGHIHPLGQKKSNEWGIYDMYGNVYEYCYYSEYDENENYFLNPKVKDPALSTVFPCLGGYYNSSLKECSNIKYLDVHNEFIEPAGFRLILRD